MEKIDQLRSLFKRCTVRVVALNNESGTGAFVAPGLVLTCSHVVKSAQNDNKPVTVTWGKLSYRAMIERITEQPYPDLSLLRVEKLTDHPCILLYDEVQLDDKLLTFGYSDKYPDGDEISYIFEGETNPPQQMLRFKFGEVRSGLSGAPVLNRRTGGVCGVAKRTLGAATLMGGRAIPTSIVFQQFPELAAQQKAFHHQDSDWYNCLTGEQQHILRLPIGDAISVFYSYAREDEAYAKRLQKHLITLKRRGFISEYHSGNPDLGTEVNETINGHLKHAHIILLMVSEDFVFAKDPDNQGNRELELAIERSKEGAVVIPIYLRRIDNWEEMPFGKLVAIPRSGRPINEMRNADAIFAELAKEIRLVVEKLRQAPNRSS